jgi:hypothetical protein
MVLLWGLTEDGPLSAVQAELERQKVPVAFVDQRLGPKYTLDFDGVKPGTLVGPDFSVALDTIVSVYARPYNFSELDTFEGVESSDPTWLEMARLEERLSGWCDVADVLVINRPCQMGSNSSKPFQLEIIRKAGFLTPETLLTTDAEAVRRFIAKHGQVIYKSISGWRSVVKRLGDDELATIDDVSCCPTQFQQYVEGVDYRVHVIGDEIHPMRIVSEQDDYRYAQDTEMLPVTLPAEVADRCVRLCRTLDLHFGGVDLRLSPDGGWYCFEVNPSPGFTYFDRQTSSIVRALASCLATGAGKTVVSQGAHCAALK